MTMQTTLDSGEEVNVQLWDTAGQERFQSLCQNFYRGSDCCILAFDLTRKETYDALGSWFKSFLNVMGDSPPPIILVGNKADLPFTHDNSIIEKEWIDTGRVKSFHEVSAQKL